MLKYRMYAVFRSKFTQKIEENWRESRKWKLLIYATWTFVALIMLLSSVKNVIL